MEETRNSIGDRFAKPRDPVKPIPKPASYHSEAGDCVFFMFSDEAYYAERVDTVLTVYRSIESQERIIGAQIKGIRKLREDLPDGDSFLGVGVESKGVHAREVVELLLLSSSKTRMTAITRRYYTDVIMAASSQPQSC